MNTDMQLYTKSPEVFLDNLLANDPRLQSEITRKTYRWGVMAFNNWRGERPITKTLLQEYMAEQQAAGKAAATINVALAAVKWYLRAISDFAQDNSNDEIMTDELTKKAARVVTVRVLKTNHGVAGRFIESGEFQALLDACRKDRSAAGRRDASIFSLLWVTGMRRAELVSLDMGDLKNLPEGFDITIRHGKGDKARLCYASGGAAKYLDDWLAVRGDAPGRVYPALDYGHKGQSRQASITTNGLHYLLKRRCEEAGVEKMSLHDFRRTFASSRLDENVDMVTLMKLLGHSNPQTTAFYDRRGLAGMREATRGIHVPYMR